ncbi:hypothetical protein CDL15_Pgr014696 [Punica granatum]|uniref:Uncharacterized protein n=1 Tax=Punica granatum TaxID=22663 RepID=A0A218XZL6_PUNGR|nr:hypothetical protein CDL15_Pgr014696 [Punica granatum]PKI77965.1 hypothetical protein CRG98_001585 [Punica granatum]
MFLSSCIVLIILLNKQSRDSVDSSVLFLNLLNLMWCDNVDLIMCLSSTVEEKAKWLINKLKGKPSQALTDLLRDHHLPPGLFPQSITCYEFEGTKGKLIVYLPSSCEVRFENSSVVRYANRVKAILSRGKLTAIEGMKTKVLVWVKVTGINMHRMVLSSLGREIVYLSLFAVSCRLFS